MHDLIDASDDAVALERSRVAREGWGRALLERQAPEGWWNANDPGWMIAMDALVLLREMGLEPFSDEARRAIARVKANLRFEAHGNRPYFEGETEPCINGAILAVGSYFGEHCERIVDLLLGEQLADGGWNCEAPPSTRSSFHTTICVLEGLLEYGRAVGGGSGIGREIAEARLRGQEYLVKRALFRRLSTGEVANLEFLQFAFPPRYHYDVLRALDYLRDAGVQPDARMEDAVRVVKSRREPDGRWLLEGSYTEALALPFREQVGQPSRWNTLRALRVLRWYERPAEPTSAMAKSSPQ